MMVVTKRLALLTGAVIVAAGLGTAYVHAQNTSGPAGRGPFMGRGGPGGPFGRGPGGPGGPGMMLRHLDLTEAQREQVKAVFESHKSDQQALAERARTAHQALQAAIAAATFDESAIRARSADVAAVDADQAVLQGRIHGEIWQLLTPAQQKEAASLQARAAERRANRQDHQGQQGHQGSQGSQGPRGSGRH